MRVLHLAQSTDPLICREDPDESMAPLSESSFLFEEIDSSPLTVTMVLLLIELVLAESFFCVWRLNDVVWNQGGSVRC